MHCFENCGDSVGTWYLMFSTCFIDFTFDITAWWMAGGFKSIPFEACTHATIGAWTWTTTDVDLGAPSWKSPELLSNGMVFLWQWSVRKTIYLDWMVWHVETGWDNLKNSSIRKRCAHHLWGIGLVLKTVLRVLHVAYYPPCITVLTTHLCCFFEFIRAAILVATVNGGRFSISQYFTSLHHVHRRGPRGTIGSSEWFHPKPLTRRERHSARFSRLKPAQN